MPILPDVIGKYLGPDKIKNVRNAGHTTPSGKPIYELEFESGAKETIPEPAIESLISDEETDANELVEKIKRMYMPLFQTLFLEYGMKQEYIQNVMVGISNNIFDVFERATHILWTGSEEGYVSGINATNQRTLSDADKVLHDNYERKQKNNRKGE